MRRHPVVSEEICRRLGLPEEYPGGYRIGIAASPGRADAVRKAGEYRLAVDEAMDLGSSLCLMKPFSINDVTGVLDVVEAAA